MALKVKVSPAVDYLYAFLQTRGFELVEDNPQILHYTGNSLKELKVLLKEGPDLLIIHSESFYKFLSYFHNIVFWVYQPVMKEKDLYQTKVLYTNSQSLCQTYYQKLGIQAEIKVIPRKKQKPKEMNIGKSLNKLKSYWQRFSQIMYWQ